MFRSNVAPFLAAVAATSCSGAQCMLDPPPKETARWIAAIAPHWDGLLDSIYYAERGRNGDINLIAGGLRVRMSSNDVRFAREYPIGRIVSAAPVSAGWLFATSDGELFAAATFDGPLQSAGPAAGTRFVGHVEQSGVLAMFDPRGNLWLANEMGFRRTELPGHDHTGEAAFADANRGVVLGRDTLYSTIDGGLTYASLGAVHGVVESINVAEGGIDVHFEHSTRRVGRTGHWDGPRRDPFEVFRPETLDEIDWQPRQAPAAFLEALASNGLSLVNGTLVTRRPSRVLEVILPNGDSRTLPLPAADCRLYPFGERLLASCRSIDSRRVNRFVSSSEWGWRLVQSEPEDDERWLYQPVIAEDGTGFLIDGACNEQPFEKPVRGTQYCWIVGDVRRTQRFDHEVVPSSMAGSVLAYLHRVDGRMQLAFADLSADGTHGRASERFDMPASLAIWESAATADGLFYAIASDERHPEPRHRLAIGGPGTMRLLDLPRGSTTAAFADRSHGIAVGRRMGDVWTTCDGAVHWEHFQAPIDGDASEALISSDGGDILTNISCTSHLCRAGTRVAWMQESAAARFATDVRVVGRARPQPLHPWDQTP